MCKETWICDSEYGKILSFMGDLKSPVATLKRQDYGLFCFTDKAEVCNMFFTVVGVQLIIDLLNEWDIYGLTSYIVLLRRPFPECEI